MVCWFAPLRKTTDGEQKMKGIVEIVEPKLSKKGDKYLLATVAGKKYGVWDTALFGIIQMGEVIEFTASQKGDYSNITSAKPSDLSDEPVVTEQVSPTKPRENVMRKMNALNNSVQLMRLMQDAGVLQKELATPTEAKRLANDFLDWMNAEE